MSELKFVDIKEKPVELEEFSLDALLIAYSVHKEKRDTTGDVNSIFMIEQIYRAIYATHMEELLNRV